MPATPEKGELILALDVAHESIKVVAALRTELKIQCKHAAIVSTMRKGAPASLADILFLMKETLAPWNFQPTSVRVALSGNAVTVRFLNVPKISKEALLAEVKGDSAKFFPVPLLDAYIDCDVFAPPAGGKLGERVIAVIAAVKKDAVQDLSKLLKGMNVSVMLLDVSSLAVFNAFEAYGEIAKAHAYKSYAVLDIGSHTSHCAVIKEGIPVFMRELVVGGAKITEALSQGLSMDAEKAEITKRSADPALKDHMEPVFKLLGDDISNSLSFFETESTTNVDGIYITGGAALTPGLAEYLQKYLETPVHLWNPFESAGLEIDEAMAGLKPQGPFYSVCCGLIARTDKL